jgi:hypothetical protein
MEFCPVCMLRKALADGVESGEASAEDKLKPAPEQAAQRFEHYELVTGEDGEPVELGRGAMGVTYKYRNYAGAAGIICRASHRDARLQNGSGQLTPKL